MEVAEAGDIVAVIGIKDALTGDTLCTPDEPIILERMTFPETVISMSVVNPGGVVALRWRQCSSSARPICPLSSVRFIARKPSS